VPAPPDLPRPQPPPAAARDAAREILSRPEFRQPPKSLYDRIIGWLGHLLDRALSALFSGGQVSIVGWIFLVAFVALLAYLGWRISRNVGARSARGGADPLSVTTSHRRTAAAWEADAVAREQAGDWRGALRSRYRALIARLGSIGAVEDVAGRTAGEYRAEVRSSRPGASAPFGEATDLFERAWYGGVPTARADTDRFRALAEHVLVEANP
jgi:hypothetical protein